MQPTAFRVLPGTDGVPSVRVVRSSGDEPFDSAFAAQVATARVGEVLADQLRTASPFPDSLTLSLGLDRPDAPATAPYFTALLPVYPVSPVRDRGGPDFAWSGPPTPFTTDVQYIVNADGSVDPWSIVILSLSNPRLVHQVREHVVRTRYFPYTIGGCPVEQLVQRRIRASPDRPSRTTPP